MLNPSLCKRFENKSVLVTGSTAGIGRAIAYRLACEGAHVFICSRKQEAVDETLSMFKQLGLQVSGIACNVEKIDQRKLLYEHIKSTNPNKYLDCVVANVATNFAFGNMLDVDQPAWDKTFSINLTSAFFLVKETVAILAPKGAAVLFISSALGFNPTPPLQVYGITKTAMIGLTIALAHELGSLGIRVNCLAPGTIRTRFSTPLWESDSATEASISGTILKRLGESSEMGGPAAFLLSDDASYITGETIIACLVFI
eukprot:GHVL01022770.1.p1 GENE.GHVL01022770.1~~GHVL01022770.1.p1  ORF type:complete len:257 (-),score=47.61 GHVL01022770.1:1063-1833(-)